MISVIILTSRHSGIICYCMSAFTDLPTGFIYASCSPVPLTSPTATWPPNVKLWITHSFSFSSTTPTDDIRSPLISCACVAGNTVALPIATYVTAFLAHLSRTSCYFYDSRTPAHTPSFSRPNLASTPSRAILSSTSALSILWRRPKYAHILHNLSDITFLLRQYNAHSPCTPSSPKP